MKADQIGNLPQVDGSPVITLMADPSQVDPLTGEATGFLSLVPAGANLRTFTAVKGAELPDADAPAPTWWDRVLATFGRSSTRKEADPTDFNAALACEQLERARWQASEALWEVIGNIMADATITDKGKAVGVALEQFKGHILGLVGRINVTKAVDAAKLAEAWIARPAPDPITVAKAGKVISAANMDKVATAVTETDQAIVALTNARTALADLVAAATPSTAAKALTDPPEDTTVKLTTEQIAAVAEAAGITAIKVAKAAGVTDVAALTKAGAEATAEVFKAAVMMPQAALPSGTLEDQMAAGPIADALMKDPTALVAAVLSKLGPQVEALVSKALEPVAGRVGTLELVIKGDEKRAGLLDAIDHIGDTVDRIAGTPRVPRSAGGDPEAVRKSANASRVWDKSAFDLSGTKPG